MSNPTIIVKNTFDEAFHDKSKAKQLLRNPAELFRNNGLSIPKELDEPFNLYFKRISGDITTQLNKVSSGEITGEESGLLTANSVGCTICKVAAYSVAIAITAVGAAGLALLTVESGVVLALAAFAGVSASAALAFIAGLTAAVAGGVDMVATEICRWTGACAC